MRWLLHHLSQEGSLNRIRRGLYVVNPPGAAPLHPFVIATAFDTTATVVGWAALHHHGFTEQLPRIVEVMVGRRSRGAEEGERQLVAYGGDQFEIVPTSPSRLFGVETLWFDNERARIFDRERSVLDLFVRVRDFGGLGTALAVIETHHREMDLARLVAHAVTLDVTAVAKRLGWVLERLGVDPKILRPLSDLKASSYSLLDPTRPDAGPREHRWRVRNNMKVERE